MFTYLVYPHPAVYQEQRDSLLDRGPALEALVESYTGHRHLSAAQQRDGLKAIVDKVPDSAGPAAKAFALRSLATLQVRRMRVCGSCWGFGGFVEFLGFLGDFT